MARNVIGSEHDDENRNKHNDNYKQLFDFIPLINNLKENLNNFLNGTNVVSNGMIKDGAITTAKLNNLSVSTEKLGSRSVTNEKLADGAVNNYKLANKSVTQSKIDEGAVDLTKFSAEVNTYMDQKSNDDIDVDFELGGWNTGGSKVTGSNPVNVRAIVPIFLRKGMKLTQTPNAYYEYELIERSTSVVGDGFYVDRTGYIPFGTDYTIERNNFYYLFIRRKDGAVMTADDVVTINARFNNIVMDYYALVGIDHIGFELGGWNTGGAKVTGENPVNIRSSEPIYLRAGEEMKPGHSNEYMYELLIRETNIPADDSYIDRTGKMNFDNAYKADHDGYHYLVVHNNDNRAMELSDVNTIDDLFNNYSGIDKTYIINLLNEYGLIRDVEFAKGGWNTGGTRIVSDAPINVSPTQLQNVLPGQSINFVKNTSYEYELFLRKNDAFVERTGYMPFGDSYVFDDKYEIAINVRRADQSPVNKSDVTEVSTHFSGISHSKSSDNQEVVSKFSVVGNLNAYNSNDIDNYFAHPNTMTPQEFNEAFISLSDENNDIFSSELLGQDDYGYNIYKFETHPHEMLKSSAWNTVPTEETGEPLSIPKIIITSGIHGREKNANYAVYYFFKQLLENRDDETLNTLLMNVQFVIVPLVCPSGFADVTYDNRNGINLNRDFPPYGSASQPETVLLKQVLDGNSDADYHLDFHNHTAHDTVIGYSLTDDDSLARLTTNAYKYIGRQWQIKIPEFPQDRTYQWAYTSGANVGTVGRYSQSQLGIPSSIIETGVENPWIMEDKNGANATQIGVDLLANTIIGILQARR